MIHETFIEVAEDCPAVRAEIPPARDSRPTKAAIEYELIAGEPYALIEEEVAFRTRAVMRGIPEADGLPSEIAFFRRRSPVFASVRWLNATDGGFTSTR